MHFGDRTGSLQRLVRLAYGKVKSTPFEDSFIRELQRTVRSHLESEGCMIERHADDRRDEPIDYRCIDLLLRICADPEVVFEVSLSAPVSG